MSIDNILILVYTRRRIMAVVRGRITAVHILMYVIYYNGKSVFRFSVWLARDTIQRNDTGKARTIASARVWD